MCVVICEGVYNCVLYMCERTHIADYSLYRIDLCVFFCILVHLLRARITRLYVHTSARGFEKVCNCLCVSEPRVKR